MIEYSAEDEVMEDEINLNKQPNEQILYDLADLYKVFGDTTRIKILYVLLEKETFVQDIALSLNMSQSAVSHQLRVLKNARLVKFRKDGKTVYYSLDDTHVEIMLKQGIEHISHR